MRKLSFLALVLAMCLCLGACSSGEAPSVPEEPTTAVPEYSFINSDRYVQSGTTGIGYRVAIGDGATEEEMRAVFGELCSADSYDLHTVWFYGLPSDVEDVGSFSVGMLEEKSRGAEPVFTPCTYDADTIAALRERGAEIEQSDEARSIPRPSHTTRGPRRGKPFLSRRRRDFHHRRRRERPRRYPVLGSRRDRLPLRRRRL